MEKKTYYVAVHQGTDSGQILEDKEAASFQFAIHATRDEIDQLQQLFEKGYDVDTGTDYITIDQNLDDIYRMIYQLGDEETKRQIESLGLLEQRS